MIARNTKEIKISSTRVKGYFLVLEVEQRDFCEIATLRASLRKT